MTLVYLREIGTALAYQRILLTWSIEKELILFEAINSTLDYLLKS